MSKLYEQGTVGNIDVSNRVFMAPLTRNRAKGDGTPGDLAALYYAQRASGGLLITEATQVSAMGKGYINTPGIYNDDHVAAWKKITQAVHEKGGKIIIQLWHVGRISHSSLLPDNAEPVAPSAITAQSQTFTEEGMVDVSSPREMTESDILDTIKDYKNAAEKAKAAGFDGIEIHAANGYLIDQFLQDKTNHREDDFGGSIENRFRFLQMIIDAVSDIWDSQEIGVRLSPTGTFNDMGDSNPEKHFGYIIEELNKKNLAYLHMVEAFPGIDVNNQEEKIVKDLRAQWKGFYISNGGYGKEDAEKAIDSDYADAITFGRPFISNPDLPERLREGAELNDADQTTFYGGGAEGYTDYPFLDEAKAA